MEQWILHCVQRKLGKWRGAGGSQGRLCGEEALLHWVLKNKQEGPHAEAGGQSGGASCGSGTYYQPSPWLQWFVSVFPLEMTDSATEGSSCLSGAVPGLGAPTPCCRGCEALIKETAEARDPSSSRKGAVRSRGGESRVQCKGEPGWGTGTKYAPVLLGRSPALLHLLKSPPLLLHSFFRLFLMASGSINSSPLLTWQVNVLPLKDWTLGSRMSSSS